MRSNWINNNPDQARQSFNAELEKLTKKTIPDAQLKEAFSRLDITYDPIETSLYTEAENQYKIGFLDSKPGRKIILCKKTTKLLYVFGGILAQVYDLINPRFNQVL